MLVCTSDAEKNASDTFDAVNINAGYRELASSEIQKHI